MEGRLKKFDRVLLMLILIVAMDGLSSCEKYSFSPPSVDPNAEWSFSSDIQPIFSAKCALASCHGGPVSPRLTEGNSYQALKRGGFINQPAETSRIYVQLTEDDFHKGLTTQTERLKILYWITQGAENNK